MKRERRLIQHLNAFLKHTRGKCPIIGYFEPILPMVKCAVEHRLVSGVAYWAVYEGMGIGENFVRYRTGERVPEAKKRSRGPGGVPFVCADEWEESVREGEPAPLDAPYEYRQEVQPEAVELINQAGLFFYSFLPFDEGRVDSLRYLGMFGGRWIPGLLSEEDHSVYPHLSELHKEAPIADRNEAYAKAMDYALEHFRKERPYGLGGSGVAWYQAAALTRQGRWDHELANGNFQVQAAFLRGVSRQHDIPFVIYAAPWGYDHDGMFGVKADPEIPFGQILNCPLHAAKDVGKPDHLLEREAYFSWFSGPAALVLEDMQLRLFKKGKDKDTFEPTAFSEVIRRLNRLAFDSDFDRGEPLRPACILLDERHGWTLPHHPDARSDTPFLQRRKVWGLFDYENQDVMVDNLFGAIYPGYEMAGGCGCTGGNLAPTPYGDSFDVLFTNAGAKPLARYPVAILAGCPEPTPALQRRLEEYVIDGGSLLLNISQVAHDWEDFLGVRFSPRHNMQYTALGVLRPADCSEWLSPPNVMEEPRYRYVRLEADGAETLAVTERGDPLVLCHTVGRGKVCLIAAEFAQEISGAHRPNGLLNVTRETIARLLEPHQKMRVRGRRLHYMVNETPRGLSVMVLNNEARIWRGWVSFPGHAGAEVREWYAEETLQTHSAERELAARLVIPPYGLRLLSVTGRKPQRARRR